VPIVREVLLSDRDFLGLLYLREDREEAEAGIPDDNPFLAEHATEKSVVLVPLFSLQINGGLDGNERVKGENDLNRAAHGIWLGKKLFANTVHARKVFHALEVNGASDDVAQAESELPPKR
jgi:hypothetical protein